MKKLISYGISIIIAIGLIILIKPYIEEKKQKDKYAFTVSSINGDISLDSFKGKALAVYFGYTFCPDVCPTSLASLAFAVDSFPKEKQEKFEGLFISVDPNRDTLENLEDYAKYFHPKFKGATSNKNNIDNIVNRYGTYYKNVKLEGSAMDYSVAHTSYIYFFDKDGNFVKRVDHFSNPNDLKEVLKTIL
jgi:protein SCO1/2